MNANSNALRSTRSRKSAAREGLRDEMLATATRLFSERGFESVTIDDICAPLGVTRGTLFWHFGSVGNLHDAAVELCCCTIIERLESETTVVGVFNVFRKDEGAMLLVRNMDLSWDSIRWIERVFRGAELAFARAIAGRAADGYERVLALAAFGELTLRVNNIDRQVRHA